MTLKWTSSLDVAWGSLETSGTLIEMTVDADASKFPVLEAGFMVMEMVTGKGCIVVTAGPPDFCVDDDNLLFLG